MATSRFRGTLPPVLPLTWRRYLTVAHKQNGTTVISKRPRKRGAAKSGWRLYRELEFGWLARNTRIIEPRMRQTCEELAKGTTYVWRDIAMMMMMGTYYAIELPDGSVMEGIRVTGSTNPQYILDLVTQTVGSILYRAEIGWIGLDPGEPGQVLTMVDGLPVWKHAPSGGVSGQWALTPTASPSSIAAATKGNYFTPAVDMKLDALAMYGNIIAGGEYHARIYTLTGSTITAINDSGSAVIPVTTETNWLPLPLTQQVTLTAGQRYAVAISRVDAGDSYRLPISANSSTYPNCMASTAATWARIAKAIPAIGDTFATGVGNYCAGVHFANA